MHAWLIDKGLSTLGFQYLCKPMGLKIQNKSIDVIRAHRNEADQNFSRQIDLSNRALPLVSITPCSNSARGCALKILLI